MPRTMRGLLELIDRNHFELLVAVFFLGGVVGALLFGEPGTELRAGNFTWGALSAYLCLLPLMVKLGASLKNRVARWVVWALFGWHVLSGLRHLIRYVSVGRL
jgi:hypothetical protein